MVFKLEFIADCSLKVTSTQDEITFCEIKVNTYMITTNLKSSFCHWPDTPLWVYVSCQRSDSPVPSKPTPTCPIYPEYLCWHSDQPQSTPVLQPRRHPSCACWRQSQPRMQHVSGSCPVKRNGLRRKNWGRITKRNLSEACNNFLCDSESSK